MQPAYVCLHKVGVWQILGAGNPTRIDFQDCMMDVVSQRKHFCLDSGYQIPQPNFRRDNFTLSQSWERVSMSPFVPGVQS